MFSVRVRFEWVHPAAGEEFLRFWVAPCTLVFQNVYEVRFEAEWYGGPMLSVDDLSQGDPRTPRNAEHIGRDREWLWTTVREHCSVAGDEVMKYLPAVSHAEYRGDFRIHVTFSDDSQNTIVFRQWLEGPMFEPLTNPEYFARFFVDGGTIVWPNGADIAPETLYDVPGREARPDRRLRPTKARRASGPRRSVRVRLRG
jgi:hypothetical protein